MHKCLLFCLSLSLGAALASAAAPKPSLLAAGAWALNTPTAEDATFETVSTPDAPGGGPVLRLAIKKAADPFYRILLGQTVAASLPDATRLRLRFWARSATRNRVRAVMEKNSEPYNGVAEVTPTLTREWKEYVATGVARNYGPNGLGVKFQVGQQAGVVELTGVTLENLGVDSRMGKYKAAVLPAATQARIRKYRMADLTVIVRDGKGRPIPNARVTVRQTRHAFLFGSNIFGLKLDDTSPAQKAYRERFAALFNYATLPFYWGSFEGTQGKPDYARLDAMVRWCLAHGHGIIPKGHPLVWHEVYPAWAPKDPDAAIPLLHARTTDLVTHYKDTIHYWDVVNEANSPDGKTGEGAWIKRDGPAKVVEMALGWARAAGKGAPMTFLYNDYRLDDTNVALLTQMKRDGRLPDAIGMQSHMHGGTWALTDVWAKCETFARFGRPLHFTETTVLSGPKPEAVTPSNWASTPEGEKAQVDYVAQFYTLLFSHPSLRAITWWDLSDSGAWQDAPAGLLRKDMSPKPAYDRLMTLIHKTWWTNAQGGTGASGRYTVRAFYGDYTITATDANGHADTQSVFMPEASGPQSVIVTVR